MRSLLVEYWQLKLCGIWSHHSSFIHRIVHILRNCHWQYVVHEVLEKCNLASGRVEFRAIWASYQYFRHGIHTLDDRVPANPLDFTSDRGQHELQWASHGVGANRRNCLVVC